MKSKHRINIFKKIKLFKQYKRIIKDNKKDLNNKFNMRIDDAYRIYTVLNVPSNLIGEAYSLRTKDIIKISENYLKEYSTKLTKYLDSKNLKELYEFYDVKKIGKYSFLIIVGYKLFKSHRYYNVMRYIITPIILLLISWGIFYFLF